MYRKILQNLIYCKSVNGEFIGDIYETNEKERYHIVGRLDNRNVVEMPFSLCKKVEDIDEFINIINREIKQLERKIKDWQDDNFIREKTKAFKKKSNINFDFLYNFFKSSSEFQIKHLNRDIKLKQRMIEDIKEEEELYFRRFKKAYTKEYFENLMNEDDSEKDIKDIRHDFDILEKKHNEK